MGFSLGYSRSSSLVAVLLLGVQEVQSGLHYSGLLRLHLPIALFLLGVKYGLYPLNPCKPEPSGAVGAQLNP